jgi:hypothetical protein
MCHLQTPAMQHHPWTGDPNATLHARQQDAFALTCVRAPATGAGEATSPIEDLCARGLQ